MKVQRPSLIAAILAITLGSPAVADQSHPPDFSAQIGALEEEAGGCVGVAALDTGSGKRLEYHADQRFAMCSTYKLLLTAAVLSRIDSQAENSDRRVRFDRQDLEQYAPVIAAHLPEGSMTVLDLCAATAVYSDNSAANLLLRSIGGPAALTGYVRSLGDSVTRIDRTEPAINTNLPGDQRDTTTPNAMLNTMQKILLSDLLSQQSRQQLRNWLVDSKTGSSRLRAGINPAYPAGDKSGSGDNGATNDVLVVWPNPNSPFLIAAYYTGSTAPQEARDSVLADVSRIVSQDLGFR